MDNSGDQFSGVKGAQMDSTAQEKRSQRTRERILEAALAVLREHGYAGFRTEAVALEAGVSRGAMLHHYPKKTDLVIATCEYLYSQLVTASFQRLGTVSGLDETMDAILADAREFFLGKYFLQVLDLIVSAVNEADIRADILEISRRNREPVERAWSEQLAQYLPTETAEDIAFMSFNLFRGFATRTIIWDEPDRFERIVSLWKDMVRAYLECHHLSRDAASRSDTAKAEFHVDKEEIHEIEKNPL